MLHASRTRPDLAARFNPTHTHSFLARSHWDWDWDWVWFFSHPPLSLTLSLTLYHTPPCREATTPPHPWPGTPRASAFLHMYKEDMIRRQASSVHM